VITKLKKIDVDQLVAEPHGIYFIPTWARHDTAKFTLTQAKSISSSVMSYADVAAKGPKQSPEEVCSLLLRLSMS
jgi:hypothetical protein